MGIKGWVGVAVVVASITVVAVVQWPERPVVQPLVQMATPTGGAALATAPISDPPGTEGLLASKRTEQVVIQSSVSGGIDLADWLAGTVHSASDQPLLGVGVRWCAASGAPLEDLGPAFTGESGGFRIPRDPRGEQLSFHCERFLPQWLTIESSEQVAVVLLACPVVRGEVRGPRGALVSSPGRAKLKLVAKGAKEAQTFEVNISKDGSYLFDDLPEGRLQLVQSRAKGFAEFRADSKSKSATSGLTLANFKDY